MTPSFSSGQRSSYVSQVRDRLRHGARKESGQDHGQQGGNDAGDENAAAGPREKLVDFSGCH